MHDQALVLQMLTGRQTACAHPAGLPCVHLMLPSTQHWPCLFLLSCSDLPSSAACNAAIRAAWTAQELARCTRCSEAGLW